MILISVADNLNHLFFKKLKINLIKKNLIMENVNNLKDLLIEQTRELYNAEVQELNTLNYLKTKANEKTLKQAIEEHISETETQLERLNQIFEKLGVSTFGEKSEVMHSLITETIELVDRSEDPPIKDVSIIAAIQHFKHYEISGYGTVCSFANILGYREIATLLHISLSEEKDMDKRLTIMAKDSINKKAVSPILISSL